MPTPGIDRKVIHNRLAASEAVVPGGFSLRHEEIHRILEVRARAAARPPAPPDVAERLEILVFSLAGETYGVEIRHVREVCQLHDLTAVPCTPPFVVGVMNLRGRMIAISDLRKFFDLPAKGLTELNRVIVLQGGNNELGLLADSIDGVRLVPKSDLQESLPTLTGVRERFLRGITGGMLVVLDGERLLGAADLKVDEMVREQATS